MEIIRTCFYINAFGVIEEDYIGCIIRVETLTTNNTGKENLVITNESMDKYLEGFTFIYYTGFRKLKIVKKHFFKTKEALIKSLI